MAVTEALFLEENVNEQPDINIGYPNINEVDQDNLILVHTGFEHTLADGSVVRAENVQEIIDRCPVIGPELGKLSLEQANVFLDVMKMGQAKTEETKNKNNDNLIQNIKAEVKTEIIKNHEFNNVSDLHIQDLITQRDFFQVILNEQRRQPHNTTIENIISVTPDKVSKNGEQIRLTDDASSSSTKNIIEISQEPTQRNIEKNIDFKEVVDTKSKLNKLRISRDNQTIVTSIKKIKKNKLDIQPNMNKKESYHISIKLNPQITDSYLSEVADPIEFQINETKVQADSDYFNLIKKSEVSFINNDTKDLFKDYTNNFDIEYDVPNCIDDVNKLSKSIALEDTLVILSRHMIVLETDEKANEFTNLIEKIYNEVFLFSRNNADNIDDDYKDILLNKNNINDILILIRLIGYENPEQAIFQLFKKQRIEFLLEAIRDIYLLSCDDINKEALLNSFITPRKISKTSSAINIGKTIIGHLKAAIEPFEVMVTR